jgi:hypothetical protein
MTDDEAAVLDAAKKWLAAKEGVREPGIDPTEAQRLLDEADSELIAALYRLLGRRTVPG